MPRRLSFLFSLLLALVLAVPIVATQLVVADKLTVSKMLCLYALMLAVASFGALLFGWCLGCGIIKGKENEKTEGN